MSPASPLPTRPLGTSGMAITRTGFGAWALGGAGWQFGWGPQDDAASVAAIHHAARSGINWIDTAAVYGLGHSETIVGRALRELAPAERPLVFTKCGLVWNPDERGEAPVRAGAPASVRRECEDSLRRLGVERIDLYQMHWPPDDGATIGEYWGTMLDLVREGKVRAVGLCNHDVRALMAAETIGHVDALQPPFSAVRRAIAEIEVPWCRAHHTGVIAYSPMESGLLTGTFTEARARALPHDDWRKRSLRFQGAALKQNLALAEALRGVAARHGTTVAAVAVAWTLAWPGVTGAIVGARAPEQVDGWIAAASLVLSRADLAEIAAAITRTGAGSGPVLPPEQGLEDHGEAGGR